jgi:hypothetical protein
MHVATNKGYRSHATCFTLTWTVHLTHIGFLAEHYQHRLLNSTVTMTKNPPAKQPAKAEKEQSPPLVLENFSDYQSWVREAVPNDPKTSFSAIRNDWDALSEDHTASFLGAVRQSWAAKNTQAGAEGRLLEATKGLSALKQLNDNRLALRSSVRSAKQDLRSLVEALERCKDAMNEVFSQLEALDDALKTRAEGGLRQDLQDHHEKLRQSAEAEMAQGDAWIAQCQPFIGKVEWSFNDINTVIACAEEIQELIPTRGSSSKPASDNKITSSKRKNTEEAEGPVPKAVRSSAAASDSRNRSVRADTSNHDIPSVGNRPIKVDGTDLKSRRTPPATDPQPSRSALPGGSLDDPIELSGDKSHKENLPDGPAKEPVAPAGEPVAPAKEPVAPSREPVAPAREPVAPPREPVDPRTYLYLPAHGEPGRHANMLISGLPDLPLPFVNWCRGQLWRSRLPTLEAVEPLTEAFFLFYKATLTDHDWENEPGVPFLPFSVEHFKQPWGEGRNWPNVRRLLKIVEGNDVCHTYFMRHISYEGVMIDDANKYSADYIRLIQSEGGPEYDWEQEADQSPICAPPLRETLAIPLQGLPPADRWSVSDPI